MRPDYRLARQRQRRAIKLYHVGLDVPTIAKRLNCAKTTIWRYLRDTPKLTTARRFPIVSRLPRAPYWQLHVRNGCHEIVLGRKFCAACGRWRQLVDFDHDSHRGGKPLSRCHNCANATRNYYDHHLTDAQRADRRERHRIYYNGERRKAGIPEATYSRRSVVDRVERVGLPLAPLLVELARFDDGELTNLATRAGVSPRALYRYRYAESATVRIDVADRLAVAMGTTSSLIWGDEW